jgi:hypothetical protein
MRFNDIYFSREERFSVGIDEELKKFYISIPVNIGLADAEEFYEIEKEEFDKFDT